MPDGESATEFRREFLKRVGALAAVAPFTGFLAGCAGDGVSRRPNVAFGGSAEEARSISQSAIERLGQYDGYNQRGNEQVAMLCYPGMTALDLVGPQYFFACMVGAEVHLLTRGDTLAPVPTDTGFAIVPTMHLSDCPKVLDVLFVPGGLSGTVEAMRDASTMRLVTERGSSARLAVSVCTGSLILGRAGLLEGRRATSHWATLDLLSGFGAEISSRRVVEDGSVITGAGVSAGLDLALRVVQILRGDKYAKILQLFAEYYPEPPLNPSGPHAVSKEMRHDLMEMLAVPLREMQIEADRYAQLRDL